MDQVYIEDTLNLGVENGEPIVRDLLLVAWKTFEIQLSESIAHAELRVLGHWVADLWRGYGSWVGVWNWLV